MTSVHFVKLNLLSFRDFYQFIHQEQGAQNTVPISGLKMELAGRLTTQRSIPRKTVSNAHIGKFKGADQIFKNTAQYASKNKLGAFTIKV